jgi:hypothetical protein
LFMQLRGKYMRSDIIGWQDEKWFRQHAYPKRFQTEKNKHSSKSVKKFIISNSSFISSVSNDRLSADHTLWFDVNLLSYEKLNIEKDKMDRTQTKWTICLLLLIVVLAIPEVSLSQNQDQPSEEKQGLKIESNTSGTVNTDELKQIRLAAENSEGLVEDSKKMILNWVDQAIIFHEAEVQSGMQAETLKQTVLMAPERIKKIEDELDDPLSLPENVVTTASGMKSGKREQQLRQLEADLTGATSELNGFNEQLNTLKNQLANLRPMIAAAKQRLSEVTDEMKEAPLPDTHPLLVKAQQAVLFAEQTNIRAAVELFEKRLINHDTITALDCRARSCRPECRPPGNAG